MATTRRYAATSGVLRPDELYEDFNPNRANEPQIYPGRLKLKFKHVLPAVVEVSDRDSLVSSSGRSSRLRPERKQDILKRRPANNGEENTNGGGHNVIDNGVANIISSVFTKNVENSAQLKLGPRIGKHGYVNGYRKIITSVDVHATSQKCSGNCDALTRDFKKNLSQIGTGPALSERLSSKSLGAEGGNGRIRRGIRIKKSRSMPELEILDASSSNEAAHLQQKLKNLSCELVTLRNRLHVNGQPVINGGTGQPGTQTGGNVGLNGAPPPTPPMNGVNGNGPGPVQQLGPMVNMRTCGMQNGISTVTQKSSGRTGESFSFNKPLPPHPPSGPGSRHHNNNNNNNHHNNNNGLTSGGGGAKGKSLRSSEIHRTTNSSSDQVVENRNNVGDSGSGNSNSLISQNMNYYVNQNFPKDVMRSNGAQLDCGDEKSSGSLVGTATTASASGNDGTQSETSFRLMSSSVVSGGGGAAGLGPQGKVHLAELEDLIHLHGPLTEDAILRCLQARCSASKFYIQMGPILLMANPFNAGRNALTLTSMKGQVSPAPVQKVVQEALRQQGDTGYPQAIILSGYSGSGKTYTSMLVVRELFEMAGAGHETDAFKHLTATITVLRSLGTARTASNTESSRIGQFIEVQVTEGTVYRAKVHCYFLDQNRIVRTTEGEKNYHIFYQMLAGLSPEERGKLHLGKHNERTLNYLKSTCPPEGDTNTADDALRFMDWRNCLGVLRIPFFDVVSVLSAIMLLGNVRFVESSCMDLEVEGVAELQAAASLLGVSETALRQGLTTRTHNVRNQSVRSRCDANLSNFARDSLAKSLYCRTVATIIRKANSLKRLSSTSGTLSSDSADSVNNQAETLSQHASTVGTAGSKASKSMTALNNAVRHATDGFIGILDMFGFENSKPSRLEQLCINLCAETMQHFYNTHVFKACIESCRDEGIHCDWEVDYVDNVPCIDLVSSLRTGLLSMLDVESSVRGTVESYIQKARVQHKQNPRFVEPTNTTDLRAFAIQHFAGVVNYDATDFLETNRDVLSDDLVAVFHKHRCSFGFASHLFSAELKVLGQGGIEPCARGITFRISPTSHTDLMTGDEPVSTLTQDFHARLDNLLQTLVHARPHFIRCTKLNDEDEPEVFDRQTVSKQLRAFQVVETINLMAHGYPHRMRFKAFNARYKLLVPLGRLARTEDRVVEDCQKILETFVQVLEDNGRDRLEHISINWAVGKRHIFMSEGARQHLETMRMSTRNRAATLVQSTWRGWHHRRRWPYIRQGVQSRYQSQNRSNLPGHTEMPYHPAMHNMMGKHHPMQGMQDGLSSPDMHCSPPGPSSPSGVPIPIPRTTVTGVNPPGRGTGLTANPTMPTLNSTSVATISLVSNAASSGGMQSSGSSSNARPRPQPISGTPPPEAMDRCDPKLVQQTCNLFGLDLERPPPLPPSRSYTVAGNSKLSYPQIRIMKMTFPDEGATSPVRLLKGDAVVVVGASSSRGHLLVKHKNRTLDVPHRYLELKAPA